MLPATASGASRLWAVIPAAGVGERMQAQLPKQYLPLGEHCVLDLTLARLLSVPSLAGVLVSLAAEDPWWEKCEHARHPKVSVVTGGPTRAASVLAALDALRERAGADDWVLVHDAARPCVTKSSIEQLLQAASGGDGAILARPLTDTIKQVRDDAIADTLDRRQLWGAQTPQLFPLFALHDWLAAGLKAGVDITDEASAAEYAGKQPRVVMGRGDNIKITHPQDLLLAEAILAWQAQEDDA